MNPETILHAGLGGRARFGRRYLGFASAENAERANENGRRFVSRAGRLDNPGWVMCLSRVRRRDQRPPITCAFITADWRNASFFDALIFTGSPVCGLRPMRALRARIMTMPISPIFTLEPLRT